MIIAVDFDGTLVKNDYPRIGAPIWRVVQEIKAFRDRGAEIILWTCREGESLEEAVSFCREKLNLKFHAVNENTPSTKSLNLGLGFRKVLADIYIDDKSINPIGDPTFGKDQGEKNEKA